MAAVMPWMGITVYSGCKIGVWNVNDSAGFLKNPLLLLRYIHIQMFCFKKWKYSALNWEQYPVLWFVSVFLYLTLGIFPPLMPHWLCVLAAYTVCIFTKCTTYLKLFAPFISLQFRGWFWTVSCCGKGPRELDEALPGRKHIWGAY